MSIPMTSLQILNREFLELRAKVLELAAALDRLDRAEGAIVDDVRLVRLHEAISVLLTSSDDRAERVQLIFSREYDHAWPEKFGLTTNR